MLVLNIYSMAYPDAYLEGIRLFNTGHFWHAHEQWEECWLEASAADALFYKGIIQAAAALVKWQQGNLRGLHLNWAKSKPKLACLPSPYMGLDLHSFSSAMECFIAAQQHGSHYPVPQFYLRDSVSCKESA